ncbi:twin-arginine translocase subunit TatC [Inhella sp.]|uniref:twin-arginine translocase subunit TatC n=1 Tax=Inhella sp. TaxID=1921806 RepID=UPI0035AD7EBD
MSSKPQDPDDELAGTEQPFVEHLIELRDRLVRALLAIGLGFGLLCLWPGPAGLYDLLAEPMTRSLPTGTKLLATGVFSGFMVPLKITLMGGFLIALPFVLYQLWAFVAPGLYSHEKRFVLPLVVSSTLLFFVGVAFCYFIVLPALSKFLVAVAPTAIQVAPDIEQYFGTVLTLFLVFGIAFEVPVAVVVLAALGIVSVEKLKEWRGYFAVASIVVAAIVTPPDVISQLSLFIPMCVLYEIGIWTAVLLRRNKSGDKTQSSTSG